MTDRLVDPLEPLQLAECVRCTQHFDQLGQRHTILSIRVEQSGMFAQFSAVNQAKLALWMLRACKSAERHDLLASGDVIEIRKVLHDIKKEIDECTI